MKRTVGILAHRSRPEALALAREVMAWLEERDIAVRLDDDSAGKLDRPDLAFRIDDTDGFAFLITLGGDGTILTAARGAAAHAVPILGVHMGRFGFIAETHPKDLLANLAEILDGGMRIEERMMVRGEVLRDGVLVHSAIGLNEALVKSRSSRLLQLRTYLGGALFATYPADGLIVATPTGSTAYTLSAGGPLIAPTVEAMCVTPICPHTLSARPLVLPCDETIEIEVGSDGDDVIFAIDGVDTFDLANGDRVRVRRADEITRLIRLDPGGFYRKVRDRYLYGERLNE